MQKKVLVAATLITLAVLAMLHQYVMYDVIFSWQDIAHHETIILILFIFATLALLTEEKSDSHGV